jgi:hypothetical protein
MRPILTALSLCSLLVGTHGSAKEVLTNHFQVFGAPDWVTESMVDTASSRVQNYLEWDVRRIPIRFHKDAASFRATGKVGPKVKAFFLKTDNAIHLGPEVTKQNFERILAHEVVHVIFRQKYGASIPMWLEEGFANFVGSREKADRKWLLKQSLPNVTQLKHPATDPTGSTLHYQLSTAVIEMLAEKCDLKDLLHLSVGRKMEAYLKTLCEIDDVNAAFLVWLKSPPIKAKRKWF